MASATQLPTAPFGTDQVLLYNVPPWNDLGFGVPNFGKQLMTVNQPMQSLHDEMGQLQLSIMSHVDATRRQYPSMNTIQRLGKMLNRAFSVLGGRKKLSNELRTEEMHGSPTPMPWQMHPVPFFPGPIVRNGWLSQYNRLCMLALTNIMQHSDNNLSLTVTQEMAADVLQYFQEIKLLLGMELLQIPKETLLPEEFRFGPEHYAAYKPEEVTIRVESLDNAGDVSARYTEEDLAPLLTGIPSNLIVPLLAKYPVAPVDTGYAGAPGEPMEPGTGTLGVNGGTGTAVQPII